MHEEEERRSRVTAGEEKELGKMVKNMTRNRRRRKERKRRSRRKLKLGDETGG